MLPGADSLWWPVHCVPLARLMSLSAAIRHLSALLFYVFAFVQWPAHGINESDALWHTPDRTLGYRLYSTQFTLVLWSAALYHYVISLGRVRVDAGGSGRILERGWVAANARRTHRALMHITLAVASAMTISSILTLAIVQHYYYVHAAELHDVIRSPDSGKGVIDPALSILHIDIVLGTCLSIYAFFRVSVELGGGATSQRPSQRDSSSSASPFAAFWRKRENNRRTVAYARQALSHPGDCEICVTRWANRLLGCGHTLCCCCLGELTKQCVESTNANRLSPDATLTVACPFCRRPVRKAFRILLKKSHRVTLESCDHEKQEDPNVEQKADNEEDGANDDDIDLEMGEHIHDSESEQDAAEAETDDIAASTPQTSLQS